MKEFIRLERLVGRALWNFGSDSDEAKPTTENIAPDFAAIISNAHLLTVVLQTMPKAKMRDSYFREVLFRICQVDNTINTTRLPLDMFLVWVVAKTHIMMTHVRDLKRYPAKFEFRVRKFSDPDRKTLTQLLSHVMPDLPAVDSASP